MTPGARVAAAIEILDAISGGAAAEQALLRWARASRFAGSKDRAAIRDFVFDALRHWRSDAARGGGPSGRARMLGRLRASGTDPETLFTGAGHAPAPLAIEELEAGPAPSGAEALDVPDWLWPRLLDEYGSKAEEIAQLWQNRAPVTLRVHPGRISRGDAAEALIQSGIEAQANSRSPTALTLGEGARRLKEHPLYLDGLVELQDAASQAVIDALPQAARVLDYCAGGGGKALALAARGSDVTAHDIDPARMSDLPMRAARAQTPVTVARREDMGDVRPFDLVLCDAPCSGSGAWRRSPAGKWSLTPARLAELSALQVQVLESAMAHVTPGGTLAYATCSVLADENEKVIDTFLTRQSGWDVHFQKKLQIDREGDGFYTAHLTRR